MMKGKASWSLRDKRSFTGLYLRIRETNICVGKEESVGRKGLKVEISTEAK